MDIPFTTGNFDLNIKGELNAETQEKVLKSGAIYIVQRDGATKAYLDLCGVENDKGKKVLPKDFERKSLAFNEENLAAMTLAFETALKPYFSSLTVTGSEHESGAVSPMKRATEFVDSLMTNAENEGALRSVLGLYDKSAATADRDGLIQIANTHGVGKTKPKA